MVEPPEPRLLSALLGSLSAAPSNCRSPALPCRLAKEVTPVSSDGEGRFVRTVHTYRTVIIAMAFVFVGIALLYISGSPTFEHDQPSVQTLVRELGALLVVTGGITVLWDQKGRRDFADEVLAKAQVGADIRSSGVQRLSMQWLDDVEWSRMIQQAREIEIFISYGATWRRTHWARFQEFSRDPHNSLRVYLPHPEDEATVSVLALRYASTSDRIRQQITDAAADFASLRQAGGGADIRIYYRRGDPTFTCYRFDNQIVVTLYSHRRARGDVPTILIGPGTLFNFFAAELRAIRSQGEPQPSAELSEGKK